MDLNLSGKRALVMGASQGIGKSIAKAMIDEGVRTAICARNENKLQITASEIGAELAIPCDFSQPGSAHKLITQVLQQLHGIDILVINTGGPPKGAFEQVASEQWHTAFQNLWMSAVDSIQSVLPYMKAQRWGRILIVTSVAAKEPMPELTLSNGLRAGLLGLTKSISREIAMHGVTLNALLPGYTRTERLMELKIPEDQIVSHIPARRLGTPEEFAALTTFLASQQAAYITGQAIACDGGYMKSI